MRKFDTGATRDSDENKLDYEGFMHPLVIEAYAKFMHRHRKQADGKLRDSDNWQKGMPQAAYIKSAWRHFMTLWKYHRGYGCDDPDGIVYACCAILFNVMGYIHSLVVILNVKDSD